VGDIFVSYNPLEDPSNSQFEKKDGEGVGDNTQLLMGFVVTLSFQNLDPIVFEMRPLKIVLKKNGKSITKNKFIIILMDSLYFSRLGQK